MADATVIKEFDGIQTCERIDGSQPWHEIGNDIVTKWMGATRSAR